MTAIQKTTHQIPFWATTLTLLGIIVLTSLGTWQLERLQWKNDLITKIQNAYTTEKPENITLSKSAPTEFTYGRVEGRLIADKAFLLGPPQMHDETLHLQLVVPLKTDTYTLLVNMGWTASPLEKQPIQHLQNKTVDFTGLLRFFSWNAFTPENHPEDDIWYRLDIPLITASKKLGNTYPAVLMADSSNHKFDGAFFTDARKEEIRKLPNNNHLQYAYFWFAMALTLIVIYILRFVKKR